MGVGATWRTTTASGSIWAKKPTTTTPTVSNEARKYGNTYVAGYSTFRINMSATSQNTGGTISKYTLYRINSNNVSTQIYTGSTAYYTETAQPAGSYTYKYTATDSFGVVSDLSSALSITTQTYTPATITSVTSQRWSSGSGSGQAKDDGTYARLSLSYTPAKVGNTNVTNTYWKVTVSSYTSPNQTTSGAAVYTGSILGDGTYQVKYSV